MLQSLRSPNDDAAWRRFIDLYTPLILRWGSRLGLSEAETEDLAQDVMAKLVVKMAAYEYDASRSFRSWLKTVSQNQARDFLRRRGIQQRVMQEMGQQLDDHEPAVDFLSEQEYSDLLIKRAIELMEADFEPTSCKACWMSVVDQKPAAEIAAELGITANAVYLARSKILRRLRAELAGLM